MMYLPDLPYYRFNRFITPEIKKLYQMSRNEPRPEISNYVRAIPVKKNMIRQKRIRNNKGR